MHDLGKFDVLLVTKLMKTGFGFFGILLVNDPLINYKRFDPTFGIEVQSGINQL